MSIDHLLFCASIFLLLSSIYFSISSNWIQIRALPSMFRAILFSKTKEQKEYVVPKKALWTAMSTTLGLGTMVSPIIAIQLGGPGALLWYFIWTILGAATTFTEVQYAIIYRKKTSNGVLGGPMPYIETISKKLAIWYACSCSLLLACWSGAQSNQLASMLACPSLQPFYLPKIATGLILTVLIIFMLKKGFRWIASFSSKLVPILLFLYISACSYIIFINLYKLPAVLHTIFESFFTPLALASGSTGGFISGLRWGIFKSTHSNEAGLGTQTIPHSLAEVKTAKQQGILAMASIYFSGFLAILIGLVVLVTDHWLDKTLMPGLPMVLKIFQSYFHSFGLWIYACSVILFSIGTILGNSFNGSQCFRYLTRTKYLYLALCAVAILAGALCDMSIFWAYADIFIASSTILNCSALIYIVAARSSREKSLSNSSHQGALLQEIQ